MKKLFHLTVCLLLCLSAMAQLNVFGKPIAIPDYAAIQETAKTPVYDSLLVRYQAGDPSLSSEELQVLYYGGYWAGTNSPFSRLETKELNALYKSGKRDKALQLCEKELQESPFCLVALYTSAALAQQLGDTVLENLRIEQYYRIAGTILATGDGETDTTAFHVVAVSDEYELLRALLPEYEVQEQQLLGSKCDMLHVQVKGKDVYMYFDIQMMLAYENHLFRTAKGDFSFTYKKQHTAGSSAMASATLNHKGKKTNVDVTVNMPAIEMIEAPETIEPEKCKDLESLLVNCADLLFSQPIKPDVSGIKDKAARKEYEAKYALNRLKAMQFVIAWMAQTPDYMFSLDENIKFKEKELGLMFMAAMARYAVQTQDADEQNVTRAAKAALVDYSHRFPASCKKDKKKILSWEK